MSSKKKKHDRLGTIYKSESLTVIENIGNIFPVQHSSGNHIKVDPGTPETQTQNQQTPVDSFCQWYSEDTKMLSDNLFLPDNFQHQSINSVNLKFRIPRSNKQDIENHRNNCFTYHKFTNNPYLSNYYDILQFMPSEEIVSTIDTHIKMNTSIKNKLSGIITVTNKPKSKVNQSIDPSKISPQTIEKLEKILLNQKENNCSFQQQISAMIESNHPDSEILQNINEKIIKLNQDIDNDIQKVHALIKNLSNDNNIDLSIRIDIEINKIKKDYQQKFVEITHTSKSKKVRIHLTEEQKRIVLDWAFECDKVYNACVDVFNRDRRNFNKEYTKFKIYIFNKLYGERKKIEKKDEASETKKKKAEPKISGTLKKGAPYDILTGIVKEFCSNVKSCETKMESGNILKYEMGPKNPNRQHISMCITHANIHEDGFYTSTLGSIQDFTDVFKKNNITRDCRLIYDKYFNKFHLCIPFYAPLVKINKQIKTKDEIQSITKLINESTVKKLNSKQSESNIVVTERIIRDLNKTREKYCALDPGEKVFQTFYGESSCGFLGRDMRDIILGYRAIIGKYKRILKSGINKKGQRLKKRTKKFLRKQIRFIHERIKNIVSELHNKTALFLCRNFNTILIPKFGTQSMLKKNKTAKFENKEEPTKPKKNRMPKKVKYVLSTLSHYKFRTKLENKAKDYQCQVHVVTEEYTSMCCGKCGYLSKNYSESRVKKCKNCNHEIDRDINGARNILLKNKDLIFKNLNKVEIKRRGSKVAEVEQHQVKNSKRSPISKPQMSTSKKRVRNLNPVHSGK